MSLEQQYARFIKPVVVDLASWPADVMAVAQDDEARLARRRHLDSARERLSRAPRSLAGAAARLTDVELDTAWRAALRGDSAVVEARVLPAVRPAPKRARTGSPWRASGWLSTHAPRRAGQR